MNLDLFAGEKFTVEAPAATWLAIHGFLCLGLRHPATADHSMRETIKDFTTELARLFLSEGLIDQYEFDQIQRTEQEALGPGPERGRVVLNEMHSRLIVLEAYCSAFKRRLAALEAQHTAAAENTGGRDV